MKTVKVLAIAAISASLLLTSGCSFSRYVASLDPYAPSDGTQTDLVDLKARNFLFIKGQTGPAVLIGSVVSNSTEVKDFKIQLFDASGERVNYVVAVGAMLKQDMGYNSQPALIVEIEAVPGGLQSIFISDGGDPIELLVPVLDGTLAEYRPYLDSAD